MPLAGISGGLLGGLGHRQGVIPADLMLVNFLAVFLDQSHQFIVGVSGDLFPAGQFTTLAISVLLLELISDWGPPL